MYFGGGSSAGVGDAAEEMEGGQSSEAKGQVDVCDEETDEEFYESDYEVAKGDDDLFDANVDKDVDDH